MAESAVHRTMKAIVRAELERDRYEVVEEPLFPPGRRLTWSSYRPDLLGYRRETDTEELVLVECETSPSMRKIRGKNHRSVSLQSFLFRRSSVRRILAVPQGTLGSLDMRVRRDWEVWVVGRSGLLEKARPIGVVASAPGNGAEARICALNRPTERNRPRVFQSSCCQPKYGGQPPVCWGQ